MNTIKRPSGSVLKEAILDLDEPVLFRGMMNNDENTDGDWKQLEINNLTKLLGDQSLPFRVGTNSRTATQQWDISCPVESMTMKQLIEKTEESDDDKNWYYFDYKYMHEWFKDKPEVLSAVSWKAFGFDKSGEDSTLWIGSRGAHTNCHQDSYGCNLIAQIHGRKQWLLFPPESGNVLCQIRVPYEESTIYGKFNFFCPSKEAEEAILKTERCISVILNPGEVLFVPKGWWHYVESLDLSISVNTWLPLLSDSRARLKESIVKLIVNRLGTSDLPSAEHLNLSLQSSVEMVKRCIKDSKKLHEQSQESAEKKIKRTPWNLMDLVEEYPDVVVKLNDLTKENLGKLLREKRERFPQTNDEDNPGAGDYHRSSNSILQDIVSTLCHDDVIEKIIAELSD